MADEAAILSGEWELVSNDNLYAFYKAIGSTVVDGEKIVVEYQKKDDGTWFQGESSDTTSTTVFFKSGEEFEYGPSKQTITIDGSTLTQKEIAGDLKITTVRVFDGDSMTTTITAEGIDVVGKAVFKRKV